MANRITTLLDLQDNGFTQSLKGIGASFREADGAVDKFKAGGKAAFESFKAYSAEAAMAAGTALVAFGVQSVRAFQETALEAGRLSVALGIPVEDVSRLKEVAADLGIEMGAVQTAVQKFNREVASGNIDLSRYGTELVYAKDGSVDAYESFINAATAIGKIQDPTERAAAAQKAFGRSYAQIANLMKMDAEELRAALAGVSDEQVIDDEEVQRAEAFRDAMDQLTDVLDRLKLAVGEDLVRNLTDVADAISAVVSVGEKLGPLKGIIERALNPIRGLTDPIRGLKEEITGTSLEMEGLAQQIVPLVQQQEALEESTDGVKDSVSGSLQQMNNYVSSLEWMAREAADTADKTEDLEDALDDADAALSRLKGNVDQRQAWRNLQQELASLDEMIANNESSWDELRAQQDSATLSAAAYIEASNRIPTEVKTYLYQELDRGNLDYVRTVIGELEAGATIPVTLRVTNPNFLRGVAGLTGTAGTIDGRGVGVGANGGIVTRPTLAVIGEAGAEAVVPLDQMPGASPLPRMTETSVDRPAEQVVINIDARGAIGLSGPQIDQWIGEAVARHARRRGG